MHRKVVRGLTAALFGVLVMAGSAAQAAPEFKVAGVTVSMAEDGWELFEAKAPPGMLGSGGIDGTMPSQARLALKRDARGRIQAALLISSHFGAKGPVTIGGSCPAPREGDSSLHAVRIGDPMGGPRTCSTIAGPGDGAQIVEMIEPLAAAKSAHPFEVPARAYLVWGYSVDQMAAFFSVEGLIAEGFAGLEGKLPSRALDTSFDPALAAWNEAFAASIKKSLSGIFSRSTQLPPITFKADAPAR